MRTDAAAPATPTDATPMTDFATAIGLLLIMEGLIYGAFPQLGRKLGEVLLTTPEEILRTVGLGLAILGLFIVWLVRA